jgi:hypothetical protein
MELPLNKTKGMVKQALGNQVWLDPAKYGITYTIRGRNRRWKEMLCLRTEI